MHVGIRLSRAATEPVTLAFETVPGSGAAGAQEAVDFQRAAGSVAFSEGATTAGVDVAIVGDAATEPDETFGLRLAPNAGFAGVADGLATIFDSGPLPDVPPVAGPDSASVSEGGPAVTVDVLANDTDADGDAITLQGVTQPARGMARIEDGAAPAGVLANDTDADDEALAAVLETDVANGDLSLNADGSFTYVPGETEGPDSFTCRAVDAAGLASAPVVVSIRVGDRPNGPPAPVADLFEADEDAGATLVGNLLANDDDLDGDALTVTAAVDSSGAAVPLNVPTALPEGGVVTVGADGSVLFDPAGDFEALGLNPQPEPPAATLRLGYTVSDGALSADATATIGVRGADDQAVAEDDRGFVTRENAALAIEAAALLANDADPDAGDAPAIAGIDTGATAGAVTESGDGTFTYEPNGALDALEDGETATDSFVYRLEGGGAATVFVTVEGVSVGGPLVVLGTDGDDRLSGTDAEKIIRPLGGRLDIVAGGGGADIFDFAASTADGVQDTRIIADYGGDNVVDLGAASVVSSRISGGSTFLYLDGDGDGDAIRVVGVDSLDDIEFARPPATTSFRRHPCACSPPPPRSCCSGRVSPSPPRSICRRAGSPSAICCSPTR